MKARHLAKCIDCFSRKDPRFTMFTTAELSHHTWTSWPCHSFPHSAVASTMGMSSFTVIWHSVIGPDQGSMNHLLPQYAPHPQPLDTSNIRVAVALICLRCRTMAIPFQSALNWNHHPISNLASLLSRTK